MYMHKTSPKAPYILTAVEILCFQPMTGLQQVMLYTVP